jgi:hypothetical protein
MIQHCWLFHGHEPGASSIRHLDDSTNKSDDRYQWFGRRTLKRVLTTLSHKQPSDEPFVDSDEPFVERPPKPSRACSFTRRGPNLCD